MTSMECWYRTAGIFQGGKLFMVFVVERRTTKFLPTKQYRIVLGCGLLYRNHKIHSQMLTKILPLEKYPLYGILARIVSYLFPPCLPLSLLSLSLCPPSSHRAGPPPPKKKDSATAQLLAWCQHKTKFYEVSFTLHLVSYSWCNV